MNSLIRNTFCLGILAVATAAMLAGCGGKPAYCSDLTTLQASVKDLPSAASSGGVSGLQAQLTKIKGEAQTLQSSAKSDFPSQSSAVESSISQLEASFKALPSKPTAAQAAALGLNASAVVNSVNAFTSATSSKCK